MADLSISAADLVPYRIRLTQPSNFGKERIGRLVRLEAGHGDTGWGDVAPLPGFSRDSVKDVDDDWQRNGSRLVDRSIEGFDFARPQDSPATRFESPSLRFGIEQALIGLESRVSGVPVPDVVAPNGQRTVSLAGLITDGGRRAVDAATELKAEGYRTLKLKVGRSSIDDDVETVRAVRQAVGSDVSLRLDPNRAWSMSDACRFIAETSDSTIEFIEEPLTNPDQLERLFEMTGAPIALDETLLSVSDSDLERWSFVSHLVLKPTLLGGIGAAEMSARAADRLGLGIVVSASYESGLGIGMLACLAARWCPDGPAAGLDTYRRLGSDVLARRLQVGPEMHLSELSFEPESRPDRFS